MIKELLQVKKIIAVLLTLVFCYLTIIGKVTSEQYITIFSLVIAFYFGQSTVRQAISENSTDTVKPNKDIANIKKAIEN